MPMSIVFYYAASGNFKLNMTTTSARQRRYFTVIDDDDYDER